MSETITRPRVVEEAQMPQVSRGWRSDPKGSLRNLGRLALSCVAAFVVVFVYIGVPIALLAGDRLDSLSHAVIFAGAAITVGAAITMSVLHSTNLDVEERPR